MDSSMNKDRQGFSIFVDNKLASKVDLSDTVAGDSATKKIRVSGIRSKIKKDIDVKMDVISLICKDFELPNDIYVDQDALCINNGHKKVIVKRSNDDVDDKGIAFLTAYFYMYSGLSKSQANKILNAVREFNTTEVKNKKVEKPVKKTSKSTTKKKTKSGKAAGKATKECTQK